MNKKEIRSARQAKKRRQKRMTAIILGVVAIGIMALLGWLVWNSSRPPFGETFPIMANYGAHVPEGTDPGPFNSDPPTSGPHYDGEYDAGFYEPDSPEAQVPFPEGYLGHNLEHGYVIFWYNCNAIDEVQCSELKNQIKGVMADGGGTKLIAFPRASIDVPVIMTSWGKLLRFETFESNQAQEFISANRNHAPEPNAP